MKKNRGIDSRCFQATDGHACRQGGRNRKSEKLAAAGLVKFYAQQQLTDFCLLAVSSIKNKATNRLLKPSFLVAPSVLKPKRREVLSSLLVAFTVSKPKGQGQLVPGKWERELLCTGILAFLLKHGLQNRRTFCFPLHGPPSKNKEPKDCKALLSMYGIQHLTWDRLLMKEEKHKKWLVPMRRTRTVQAVAVPEALSSADSTEYRKQLAESYGFRQIGEPLPDNVTLKDVIDTLPKKVFEIDDVKAWKAVLISITSSALGLFMISKAPWYLLPFAWAWTGTAATGFFIIGHDCAHKSFSKNKLVEDVVGTLAFLPLIYPYEPWRFKHDWHHSKTNMLEEDTAWHPVWKEEFDSSPVLRKGIIFGYGPFRPWMSIAHWLIQHFDLKKFRPNQIQRVKISLACVFGFMTIGWPLIIYKAGIMGWIKFWLMPWLGYHFWMSTFTMVHHTAPHIPFKNSDEWNAAQAQLNGTIHCDYPRWIEILCHDINVHVPHHVTARIPHYNLRAAHKSLQENWGKYMNEATWNWRLMKTIMTVCHVYDKKENYVAFDQLAPEESQPITFLKRVMPDFA